VTAAFILVADTLFELSIALFSIKATSTKYIFQLKKIVFMIRFDQPHLLARKRRAALCAAPCEYAGQ
jgi:hypothetical protein